MSYEQLLEENARLRAELQEARSHALDLWETVEDIACGAGLECTSCGKQRPCLCHDLGGKS